MSAKMLENVWKIVENRCKWNVSFYTYTGKKVISADLKIGKI